MFLHQAVMEALTCGNTEIAPEDLGITIDKLARTQKSSQRTGFANEFKVQVCFVLVEEATGSIVSLSVLIAILSSQLQNITYFCNLCLQDLFCIPCFFLINNDLDMHIQAKTNDRKVRRFGDILAPLSRETKLKMRLRE